MNISKRIYFTIDYNNDQFGQKRLVRTNRKKNSATPKELIQFFSNLRKDQVDSATDFISNWPNFRNYLKTKSSIKSVLIKTLEILRCDTADYDKDLNTLDCYIKNCESFLLYKKELYLSLKDWKKYNYSSDIDKNEIAWAADKIFGAAINSSINFLNLLNLGLKNLPENIDILLPQISIIDLSGNQLTELPKSFNNLIHLRRLNLSNNKFTSFPENIDQLSNLNKLDVSENKIKFFSENNIIPLNLEILILEQNKLQDIPNYVKNFKRLKVLNLNHNQIKFVSNFELTNLRTLQLGYNQLSSLSLEINNLINLQKLDLCGNQLEAVPECIGYLVNLRSLSASENHLSDLGCIKNLTNLEELDLDWNNFEIISESIGNLTQLYKLNLSNNNLRVLPVNIGNLSQLAILLIDYNENLRTVPMSLGNTSSLIELSATNTQINSSIINNILYTCQKIRGKEQITTRLRKWIEFAGPQKLKDKEKLIKMEGLSDEDKSHLNEWLHRLESSKAFRNSQHKLATKTCKMLEAMLDFPEFKALALPQIIANNECCQDRGMMAYNEIYLCYRLCTLPKDASVRKKLDVMVKAANTSAALKVIANIVDSIENQTESVEYYFHGIELACESANLLVPIKEMAYGEMGKHPLLNKEDISSGIKIGMLDELIAFPTFQNLLRENSEFVEDYNTFDTQRYQKLDEIEDLSWNEQQPILNQIENDEKELYKKWASKLLEDYQIEL